MKRQIQLNNKRKQQGFTLVELMVVLTIMAILIAVIVPNLVAMIQRAQNADIANNGHKFQQYLETYTIEAETQGLRIYPVKPSEIIAQSFFIEHKVSNPYYAATDTTVIADNTQGTVKYQNISAGQWIVYTPDSKALYDATIGTVVSQNGQGKGMLVYFPFTPTAHNYPSAATDQIGGYEIRGVDTTGRYINGLILAAGEAYN